MIKGFISRLSKREKTVLYVSLGFALLALMDRAVVGPIIGKLNSLEKEIQETEHQIKKNLIIKSQQKRINEEEKQYATFSVEAGSGEEETASLLKDIENLATEFSIYLIDMKPLTVVSGGGIKKYVVSLSCEAEMKAMVTFLYAMENADKLLQIGAFNITPKNKQSSVGRCELLVYKIVIP
ncbi:MAG: hypothetical protein ABII88_01410 [Candidatus Omnitrophota bacterium]